MVDKEEMELWMKMAEFRGSTISALKGINSELKEIKDELKGLNNSCKKRDLKVAGIAGTVSMIVIIFSWLIPTVLGV